MKLLATLSHYGFLQSRQEGLTNETLVFNTPTYRLPTTRTTCLVRTRGHSRPTVSIRRHSSGEVKLNLYTVKEAAEMLSVHPNTIRKWVQSGKLPAQRFGQRTIRINLSDIQGRKENEQTN